MNIKNTLRVLSLVGLLCVAAGCSMLDIGLSVINGLAKTGDYTATRSLSYGSQQDHRLDVYVPTFDSDDTTSSALPVVVFFYGGCWGACSSLTKDSYEFVAEALTAKRYIVVVTDYRRYPNVKFPAIMADASAAVEWVTQNIANYGGDPTRLFLMGHSAGAQMAAMLALDETLLSPATYSRIKGFVGLSGPYDFLPLTDAYQKVVFGPPSQYRASQPVNFVNGTEPPLMLLYGLDDKVVGLRNINSLNAEVKAKGGQVETALYEGIDHAGVLAALSIPLRGRSSITKDIVDFLDRQSMATVEYSALRRTGG